MGLSINTPTPGLSPEQRKVWLILMDYQSAHKTSMTYEALAKRLGLSSRSGAHRLVTQLCERGYVHRKPYMQYGVITTTPDKSFAVVEINKIQVQIKRLQSELKNRCDPEILVKLNDKIDGLLAKLSQWEGW